MTDVDADNAAGAEGVGTVEVLLGRIGRAHGIKGDLAIDVRSDEPERRFAAGTRFVTTRGALTIQAVSWHGRRLLVHFEEVPDRTAAEALRGVELRLAVPQDERPDDPEEFYDHQLVGLAAVTETGAEVGRVEDILHLPAQDVLVIRGSGGEGLVPFVTELVPTVDLNARRVVVVDRPGLLAATEED